LGSTLLSKPRTLVAVALASFLVTLPDSFEDFVEGVPQEFGVGVLTGGLLLAGAYAVYTLGIVLASHGRPAGYVINLLAGMGWFFGAVFDHLPDLLSFEPYRAGFPSKLLEVLVMVFGLALVLLSGRLLLAGRRRPRTPVR
jgi:hypothetical protein